MKLSLYGRLAMALLASVALGLGMTACGGGTIGYVWVLGQQYNQIAGFKVDDFTGNLTSIAGSPVSSNGTNPVMMVVKQGGRFVYVINQGTGGGPGQKGTSSGISVFSVGGDGALTYLSNYESQGFVPMWAQFDGGGTFLYVLDKYAPDATCDSTAGSTCNGSITVFQSDPNTGRLTLVQNTQSIPPNSAAPTFFEVGQAPIMMKTTNSCLLTVNSADQSLSPYSINSSTGQLSFTGPKTQALNTVSASSINGNGTYTYITDTEPGVIVNGGPSPGRIYPFTVGTNCNLNPVTGGTVQNFAGTLNPDYSLVDISNKYLYVLNQSTTSTTVGTAFSSMSAWTINPTNGQLAPIAGAPFTTGSGPVCMVEDASSQYIYVSNHNDGTVTGKVIDPTTGNLSALSRGSTFTATGQATCLGFSGAVN
ncbi:lactonase family protein [Granulicella mallensis]|uniref:Lactonase, 7-bladed beta propeller n=1 Tax=Granulicella mallensis (strain ATCC BAA-1857 / DSM 23137 / MP5ACTX8) TaxID=682795 RepID=G8NVT2_GRAMM|nr:beta-propeller fold lactonase family protein [Granulicella mallensis]AEU38835.1 Lactonase, 7-bladed beta propeller [Granulicella mallensis MP5ACTX8]